MTMVFNRIVELVGWIVLGVCVLLLVAAHHIDNYQPPEQPVAAQSHK
ncbi:division septum protein Blr [Scandinavium sp. H11S7]|uniref:Division septum protein Blr n=1 Tax=Scandinavium hiltneri TaxID=2926519 RepID=A0ABT2E1Q8_9ENTR|nr:division septum protein Blr [Scandinavium hiltneri]MCS2159193.1 division septum protein Blr [Scandinavium hiltneri]MCS2161804.1 division septum protein Blr [Scandinavium hiltneri]